MKLTVKDLNNNILFEGAKQECIHFIKLNKINRREITIQKLNDKPTAHYTIPITQNTKIPDPFFKPNFGQQ